MSQNWVWFHKSSFPTRWCPQDSVQLVQITPITMFYRWYIYGIHGVYKPIYNVWGHHLVWIQIFSLWVASKYLLLVTDFPCLITASETVVPPACLLVLSVVKPSNIWGWNVWLMILVVWVVINAVFFLFVWCVFVTHWWWNVHVRHVRHGLATSWMKSNASHHPEILDLWFSGYPLVIQDSHGILWKRVYLWTNHLWNSDVP